MLGAGLVTGPAAAEIITVTFTGHLADGYDNAHYFGDTFDMTGDTYSDVYTINGHSLTFSGAYDGHDIVQFQSSMVLGAYTSDGNFTEEQLASTTHFFLVGNSFDQPVDYDVDPAIGDDGHGLFEYFDDHLGAESGIFLTEHVTVAMTDSVAAIPEPALGDADRGLRLGRRGRRRVAAAVAPSR
jgi:hypothetical protein